MKTMRLHLLLALLLAAGAACNGSAGTGDDGPRRDPNDLDGDGVVNDLDEDIDGDGALNGVDADIDGDGDLNDADDDIDGDGVDNEDDLAPRGDADDPGANIGPQGDIDGDGIPNANDTDDDGDGTPDGVVGNNDCQGDGVPEDEASDCDGYCLGLEVGYYPCEDGATPGSGLPDTDGDGLPDNLDFDDDGDGIPDSNDDDNTGIDPCSLAGETLDLECLDGEDDDGDDTTDPPPDGTCTSYPFATGTALAPRILLVVDRSGSMDRAAEGFDGTKWTAAVDTLSAVAVQLEATTELGLMYYPLGADEEACTGGSFVDVNIAPNSADAIQSSLRDNFPDGGTPTAPTLLAASTVLSNLPSSGGQRAVVLVTDGGPNCNGTLDYNSCRCVSPNSDDCRDPDGGAYNCLDDNNTLNAASTVNTNGFPVFVLGLPGTESFVDVLQGMAVAGGTSNYYPATSSASLASSLEDIAIRVGSCRFDLPSAASADQLSVTVGGAGVGRDGLRVNGWDLVDVDTIELFGSTCQQAISSGQNVEVEICQ
jgi:hypothetical protein